MAYSKEHDKTLKNIFQTTSISYADGNDFLAVDGLPMEKVNFWNGCSGLAEGETRKAKVGGWDQKKDGELDQTGFLSHSHDN